MLYVYLDTVYPGVPQVTSRVQIQTVLEQPAGTSGSLLFFPCLQCARKTSSIDTRPRRNFTKTFGAISVTQSMYTIVSFVTSLHNSKDYNPYCHITWRRSQCPPQPHLHNATQGTYPTNPLPQVISPTHPSSVFSVQSSSHTSGFLIPAIRRKEPFSTQSPP